ncbi:hypothetical protein GLOIN_2v1488561 [Rhizophagus clarus]|uniref:Uncharacterized protein n=1 Tax=Rhizophagus clarus TaxID=94130 RepID=A0A8H3L8A6_9GLOM|nr:hypothetical protein GLOIN_2v1488561 [Rhizophagus clarus]
MNSFEIFVRTLSELQIHHQNRESRIGLIKEFLDSVYQGVTDNDQIFGQLVSYLHQNFQNSDSKFNIKNRSKIPVQVALIQRRKKHSKENDPNIMPARKKRKSSKISHNLSGTINENVIN